MVRTFSETAGLQTRSEAGSRANLFWGVFAAWALWTGFVYLQPAARSFDENWFLQLSHARSLVDTLYTGAQLGYGQLYWLLLSAAETPLGARFLSLCLALATPLVLCQAVARPHRLTLLVFWLCLPVSWWYGKIVGPESLNLLACVATVTLLARGRIAWAGFVFGLAIGIKLNALPLAAFFLWPLMRDGKSAIWPLALAVGASVPGFQLANPLFLSDPAGMMLQFASAGGEEVDHLRRLGAALGGEARSWDQVQIGGFSQFVMPAWTAVMLVAVAWIGRVSPALSLAALATALCHMGFFFLPRLFFGWYWLPFLPVLALVFARAQPPQGVKPAFLAFLAVANVGFAATEIRNKALAFETLAKSAEIEACVMSAVESDGGRILLDFTEYGMFDYSGAGFSVLAFHHENAAKDWSHFAITKRYAGGRDYPRLKQEPGLEPIGQCQTVTVYRRNAG